MTPPPTTTQKVKREGFKAETKCKISRVPVPSEIATPTRVRCGGNPGILQGGSRGRSLECRPSTSHVDSLPLPPRPGFGRQLVHAGWHPTSRPPSTAHPSRSRRWPECISNLGPEEKANRKCPYCNAETVQVPTPQLPRATTLGEAGPRSRESGPGSPPHIRAPRPKFTRVARGASWALLLGAQPSRLDWDSTPRVSRSDGNPSGDVARAPRALRATPRSQVSAVLARPYSAH